MHILIEIMKIKHEKCLKKNDVLSSKRQKILNNAVQKL